MAHGFPSRRRQPAEGAQLAGTLSDVVRGTVVKRLKRGRKPLQDRTGRVKQGRPQEFPAILLGDTIWCPAAHERRRTIHLTGPLIWHTTRRGLDPSRIPFGEVRPIALRQANPADQMERDGVEKPNWLVLDLESPAGQVRILAHQADLALLGLVAGWVFPRVRWWA